MRFEPPWTVTFESLLMRPVTLTAVIWFPGSKRQLPIRVVECVGLTVLVLKNWTSTQPRSSQMVISRGWRQWSRSSWSTVPVGRSRSRNPLPLFRLDPPESLRKLDFSVQHSLRRFHLGPLPHPTLKKEWCQRWPFYCGSEDVFLGLDKIWNSNIDSQYCSVNG